MMAMALVLGICVAGAAAGSAAPASGNARCVVNGKLRGGPELSRRGICQAVMEGLGTRGRQAELTIAITFEPPATATATLIENGAPRPPVSIAISDRDLGRQDLVDLGRTIAELTRPR